jgi:Concanavalin A-like lectin/glucanases superfamily
LKAGETEYILLVELSPIALAIDRRALTNRVTHDFAGGNRPQGLAYDVGAYELPQLPMPAGEYPLNGDALDASGYNAHGTPTSIDYSTEAVEGSAAALFNATTDRIVIPTDAMNLDAFTITAWVKPTSLSRAQYIVGVTTNPWANRIQLFTQPGTGQLALGLGDNHNLAQAIQPLSIGVWYHVALVYDHGLWWVYVNGAEKDNGIATGLTQLAPTATIGNNGLTQNQGWNGLLDAVTIYSSALTADEVLMDCHLYTSCGQ